MSRLDELIQELCPEGVPLVLLGELEDQGLVKLGRGNVISKADLLQYPGQFPVYSSSAIGNGEFGQYGKFMFDDERITWSVDGGGRFFYRPAHKYSVTNVAGWIKVLEPEKLLPRYLFFVLINLWEKKTYNYIVKAHPSVIREDYLIPLVPLEVQSEIVSILDKFTQLEAELEAELEARRVQYEETRNNLLNFDQDLSSHPLSEMIRELCREGVPKRPLGDLVENRDNERQPITKGLRNSGAFPYYGANGVQDFVDSYIFDGTFLLVGEDGSVIGPDDAPVLNWATGKIWVNNHAHVLEEKPGGVNLRFLYFFLSTTDVSRFVTGGTQKKINQSNLNKIPIAVPPLEIQREIVSILDKLDTLVNDISFGLPAEIATRRKQYEYYRNKLLTFKELDAA